MGEVWHAFDLKLRVEVALKALRGDIFKSERRLELLRQEVRAAREVVSPNVCRIFDLIEVEGRELVSMEYVDGATLLGVLQERGPLELKEAQDIASQFLAGLEAIHKVGLIHRDIKPENIMLTRAGRVVVMDFGLARQEAEGGGSVSGTPAYMAPEQAAGQTLDARADVYAAGVVLAEMVSPEGIKSYESRQSVWEGVRSEPAKLPDSPWAPAIKKAVAKDREQRYHTAHTLTRALEDVTLRVEGAEDLHPYPGLASFTESDAEYFFGREAEVEQMWRRLERTHLLAIVGSSGAGKTSFIGAGLTPNAPNDWSITRCTPGIAAISSLRKTLIHELAGNTEALEKLVDSDSADALVNAASHWRKGHGETLLVIDQFEELFTQNPDNDQTRFAALVGRFVVEADVRVLLSMRDDFLIHCNRHESLRPIFHEMTVLDPPAGANLRRALVQPAQKCGYRFEDDELVEEMLAEVEGERGALPMLAFATARLWEKRDRDTGLLTRQTHHDIGGVGGALARHAEATIDRIGADRITIVRELFRNLVTAEGTRAVREWNELLSIFDGDSHRAGINPTPTNAMAGAKKQIVGAGFTPARSAAEDVLRELIDARLLTSYEIREEDEAPTRSVEIIHESLLANWPRLVRWQTQDQEGAQLRDELRQAARSWEEHGRHDDRLWTGTAFREYQLWRERYSGGLTESEETFAAAMTSLATRRRRRRRIAVAAAFVMLLAVLGVVGVSRQQAIAEANRAEASKLLALAHVQLDAGHTEALAYTTASLELADTAEARKFVMKALWTAPPALFLNGSGSSGQVPVFSLDGSRLVVSGHDPEVLVWSDLGGDPLRLPGHSQSPTDSLGASMSAGVLVTLDYPAERIRVWSIPDGQLVRSIEFSMPARFQLGASHLMAEFRPVASDSQSGASDLRRWKLPDGEVEELGSFDKAALGVRSLRFRPNGEGIVYAKANEIYYRSLPVRDDEPPILIGRHDNDAGVVEPRAQEPDHVWSQDMVTGERRRWSLSTPSGVPLDALPAPPEAMFRRYAVRTGDGKWRARRIFGGKAPWSWDLSLLPGAQPLEYRANTNWYASVIEIHPAGKWLVASADSWDQLVFFPLVKTYPSVVDGYSGLFTPVVFSRDGEWLATGWGDGTLRLWPLPSGERRQPRTSKAPYGLLTNLAFDAAGKRLVTAGYGSDVFVVPSDGRSPMQLKGFSREHLLYSAAFSPSGRLVAAGTAFGTLEKKVLRVWDLETGDVRVFQLEPTGQQASVSEDRYSGNQYGIIDVTFIDESTLYTSGWDGVHKWDLVTGDSEVVVQRRPETLTFMAMSANRTTMVTRIVDHSSDPPKAVFHVHDIATGISRPLHGFGDRVDRVGLHEIDPSGQILITGDAEGVVRVGRIDGGAPHILLGHEGPVRGVAISPDLEWVASTGQDETLRLWPMPDLSKPPLHTQPHDELIAKLHSLTNLRVVRDQDSPTGWKVEVGPFPGWETVPTW